MIKVTISCMDLSYKRVDRPVGIGSVQLSILIGSVEGEG